MLQLQKDQAQPQADQDESAESAESANERKKLSLDALQSQPQQGDQYSTVQRTATAQGKL